MNARVAPAVIEGWDDPFFCDDDAADLDADVDFPVVAFGPVGGAGVEVEGVEAAPYGAGDDGVDPAVFSLRLSMIGVGRGDGLAPVLDASLPLPFASSFGVFCFPALFRDLLEFSPAEAFGAVGVA